MVKTNLHAIIMWSMGQPIILKLLGLLLGVYLSLKTKNHVHLQHTNFFLYTSFSFKIKSCTYNFHDKHISDNLYMQN